MRMIVDWTEQLAQRKIELGNLAQEMRNNPVGFQKASQELLAKPVIPKLFGVPIDKLAENDRNVGSVPSGYRSKEGTIHRINPVE